MKSPIVTAAWLHAHLQDPDLIILDAYIETPILDDQIVAARPFDIKNKFSDTSNPLPNTLPDPEIFALAARKLGINKNSTIVVYDTKGIFSSPRAWWLFKIMGHDNVYVLDGGFPAWAKENFSIEKQVKMDYKSGDFESKFNPAMVKSKEQILTNIDSKEALLIDARSTDRFNAETEETRAGLRTGHIPNAINMPFQNLLMEGHFLTKEKLEKILPFSNKPLVFTCGSGVTACIDLLAYELIGENNPKAIYDGSWTEWGQDPNLPIEK